MSRALCLLDVRALPMALLSPPKYDRTVSAMMVSYLGCEALEQWLSLPAKLQPVGGTLCRGKGFFRREEYSPEGG